MRSRTSSIRCLHRARGEDVVFIESVRAPVRYQYLMRRNRLTDFASIMANGKIAMKLENGDRLVGVATCRAGEDVLLAARSGKCIRFAIAQVRVFSGRTSTGVRGIRLARDDAIVSMTVLGHTEFDTEAREAYIRYANGRRRAESNGAEASRRFGLSARDIARFEDTEQFILTVTENGYGKRSSAHEYRVTGRGGQGVTNIETSVRNGPVVAAFPVEPGDQIMLVTDGGTMIRLPVDDVRIAGRRTQGVRLFATAQGERVVSATRLADPSDGIDEGGNGDNGAR